MTREERLQFCEICINKKLSAEKGLICSITGEPADFEDECSNFSEEKKKADPETFSAEVREYEDVRFAIIGGFSASLFAAAVWALISVITDRQIGYMAVGAGFLVGIAVRNFGGGVSKIFGITGAVFSLLACLLGNLFTQIWFISQNESLGFFEIFSYLDFSSVFLIFKETFNPIDLLFYGIAVYEGYIFSFRNIKSEISAGKLPGEPKFYRFRLPVAVATAVSITVVIFMINIQSTGFKTLYYPSGEKMAAGTFLSGLEDGFWSYWQENGNLSAEGYFARGKQDSIWKWYNENGCLVRKGTYQKGLEHGSWINYYDDGFPADSCGYSYGRKNGVWIARYDSGALKSKGYYKNDLAEGNWSEYFENGIPVYTGSYMNGKPEGIWKFYYENGNLLEESQFISENKVKILNAWDKNGKQTVTNGKGNYRKYHKNGTLSETVKFDNGNRTGKEVKYFSSGKKAEEGIHRDGIYYIENSWTFNGEALVQNGNGIHSNYADNELDVWEKGEIKNGLRDGEWITYSRINKLPMIKAFYTAGKQNGAYQVFNEEGNILTEGNMSADKREGLWKWYNNDSSLNSTVEFVNNLKEGSQYFYNRDGSYCKEEIYKNGKLVDTKIFDD